ncbi:splicing endonuclease 1 [Euphorbia peplus]|nr:splicing endonuclease 1 [Euphorbia peplus]
MMPRWKGKIAEAKAVSDPMSKIVSELSSSLTQSNLHGLLTGLNVLIAVEPEQTQLLTRSCFGRPIINAEKDKQWFQLGLEEAFYLHYHLKCLKIVDQDDREKNSDELWRYMRSKMKTFPDLFKVYSHLRTKNWVVKPGSQYGVDFVAYRHHPSFVHSEYAVVVSSDGEGGEGSGRLRVWSDFYCTIRLCGSVAKSLLVVHIGRHGNGDSSPECLEGYSVEEQVITRWSLEQNREDRVQASSGNRIKKFCISVKERTILTGEEEQKSGFIDEHLGDEDDEIEKLEDEDDVRD